MASFVLEIEGVGDLPVTPVFAPQITFNARRNGDVQGYTQRWPFSGILQGPTSEIETKRDAILAAFEAGRRYIKFKLDGSVFEELRPGMINIDGGSPRFDNFNVVATPGGSWVSILRYQFTVVADFALFVAGVTSFDREWQIEETEDGIQTVLVVNATGRNAGLYVRSQRPRNTVSSRIIDRPEQATASATYKTRFESNRNNVQRQSKFNITISGGFRKQNYVSPIGREFPDRFFGTKTPARVRMSGKIVGTTVAEASRQPTIPADLGDDDIADIQESPVIRRDDGQFERDVTIDMTTPRRPDRSSFDLYEP